MGGRAVAASCLSLLGYFLLHIVLQEGGREGGREGGKEVGEKKKREEKEKRGEREECQTVNHKLPVHARIWLIQLESGRLT